MSRIYDDAPGGSPEKWKTCPACYETAEAHASLCRRCGRMFHTQFDADGNPLPEYNASSDPQFSPPQYPPQHPSLYPPPPQYGSQAQMPHPQQPGQYPQQQYPQQYQQQQYPNYSAQMPSPFPVYPPEYYAALDKQGIIQYPPGYYNPLGAIICSFLVVGLGQILNRQVSKGVWMIVASLVLALPTFFIAPVVIGIISLVDGILIANRLQRGEPVGKWQFF